MTSRELTSGFNFCSCGHLQLAVIHLFTQYGGNVFIQSRYIDIFSKFSMTAASILDFHDM